MIFGVALCDNGFMHHGKCVRSVQAALTFRLRRSAWLEGNAGAGRDGAEGEGRCLIVLLKSPVPQSAVVCCIVLSVRLETIQRVAHTEGFILPRIWLGSFISHLEIDSLSA